MAMRQRGDSLQGDLTVPVRTIRSLAPHIRLLICRDGNPVAPLMGVVLLTGCSSMHLTRLYVHDADAQTAATAAQTGWKAVLPSGVFDQQKTYLAKLAADEVTTAKIEVSAQRDLQLIQLINGTNMKAVNNSLGDHLNDLVGARSFSADAALDQKVADDRVAIDNDTAIVSTLTARLKVDGYSGELPTCDATQSRIAIPSDNQQADLTEINTTCASLKDKQLELDHDIGTAFRAGSGELSDTLAALDKLTLALKDQQKKAAALQQLLDAKKKAIDSANKGSSVAIAAASSLRFCLSDPSTSANKGSSTPPAGLGADINTCAVNLAQDADPLVKQVKHSAVRDQIQSVLTSLLQANAGPSSSGSAAPKVAISASTTAALRTLDSLADVADAIDANRVPSVNSLLVALAYEQYQANVNSDQVETLKQRIRIYEDRREAYMSEISFIARAQQELAKPSSGRDLGRIRSYVNSAWNIGAYRAMLSQYAEDDLTRAASLRVSSTIVTGWENVLQPAFDELVAYGKGGLDAQTVSNLALAVINAGGFAAVAKGVNK
jgi:hypothetical protein